MIKKEIIKLSRHDLYSVVQSLDIFVSAMVYDLLYVADDFNGPVKFMSEKEVTEYLILHHSEIFKLYDCLQRRFVDTSLCHPLEEQIARFYSHNILKVTKSRIRGASGVPEDQRIEMEW